MTREQLLGLIAQEAQGMAKASRQFFALSELDEYRHKRDFFRGKADSYQICADDLLDLVDLIKEGGEQ